MNEYRERRHESNSIQKKTIHKPHKQILHTRQNSLHTHELCYEEAIFLGVFIS